MSYNHMRLMASLLLAVGVCGSADAQSRKTLVAEPSARQMAHVRPMSAATLTDFTGTWVYRSYRSLPDVIVGEDPGAAARALSLLFGEGIMSITVDTSGKLSGTFDMGGGYVLDLSGTVSLNGRVPLLRVAGIGRPGSPTDSWEYDYVGYLSESWPSGINQVPAFTGTVIRAKPHGTAKAGYVASFIATKRP